MTLGLNLKKFRQERKITQEELANKLGKSKGVISNWEKEINRPDVDTISQICKLFSITPNELFDWENVKTTISQSENTLLKYFNKLNKIGKEKALERLDELTQISKYTLK